MRPRSPSGPLRQSVNATNRPTTTGGSAMPVLTTLTTSPRLRNRDSASHVPIGNPISRLIAGRQAGDGERQERDLEEVAADQALEQLLSLVDERTHGRSRLPT